MSFEYSQELADDYENLLKTDGEYNVIIYAGKNKNVEEIHSHSIILCIRSQYFRTAFSNELTKKKDGKYIFNFPNISPQFFKIILRFIYCGKIDLEKLQGPDILKLLVTADELKIQRLVISPLLELLLKRDDLSLDEIIIWNSLIKWCFSQHPTIQQDVNKWNKEEIVIMERTIHRFIPLIRFYHIPSADFVTKVYPFKEILPKDIVNNILVFHMAPDEQLNVDVQSPRKPKCVYDSVIVGNKHFAIFSNWIEKKNESYYDVKNVPYNFNLLYRASRDGNTIATFHAKCDNKGATIVIVKIANSEQIVGGYNSLYWNLSSAWKSTRDSFIFSFANKDNLQSAKVGYSNGDESSIYSGNINYGPLFGGGNDLGLSVNNGWYRSYSNSYPDVDIPLNKFKTDDYEVFQVVKK
ncbi:hypothetical protein GLOIN_2v1872951 [Rhizophagus irregularis DAOM 181602=DAOM 197198]|nr:hypothetical protein GLOIN_2v1872951 [Rhizophagus irregularis DAOM 181602=DAOM 197198]